MFSLLLNFRGKCVRESKGLLLYADPSLSQQQRKNCYPFSKYIGIVYSVPHP